MCVGGTVRGVGGGALTMHLEILGYIPPEQKDGRKGSRSDRLEKSFCARYNYNNLFFDLCKF